MTQMLKLADRTSKQLFKMYTKTKEKRVIMRTQMGHLSREMEF